LMRQGISIATMKKFNMVELDSRYRYIGLINGGIV
jgi:hypothetical protein